MGKDCALVKTRASLMVLSSLLQKFAQQDKSGDLRNSEELEDAAEDGEGRVLVTVGVKGRE